MAARKFCLMTEGRSGSTSLMEALESFDDIAVPNKNISCPDNELVHLRFFQDYCNEYSRLADRKIRNANELIEVFFQLNDTARYQYMGFKSMPNRHPDFPEFTARKDIRFITLKRRDIVSTSASFMVALARGSWRRHGEGWDEHWTFDPTQHAESVKSNLAYIYESHKLLDSIADSIPLYYEDLCNPEYQNAALDEFFMRQVRIKDPKPPTVASSYVTNWDQFSHFVEETWESFKKPGVSPASITRSESIPIPRPAGRAGKSGPSGQVDRKISGTGAVELTRVRLFCQFVGGPLSGANLIMVLLNAHPDIAIGHETAIFKKPDQTLHLSQVAPLILESAHAFINNDSMKNPVNLHVPNQWQGRYRQLQVLGDDAVVSASLRFRDHPGYFEKLRRELGVDVRFIHVFRNPFDNIASISQASAGSIQTARTLYFSAETGVEAVRKVAGNEGIFDLCLEEFVRNPAPLLRKLCDFLGVECTEQYLQDCMQTVFKSLPKSRNQIVWTTALLEQMQDEVRQHPPLQRYIDNEDFPYVADPDPLAFTVPEAFVPSATHAVSGTDTSIKPGSRKRVVYAWELGMDLGHILPFLPLAQQLRDRGHEVIFVIRDLTHAETIIGRLGFQVIQAPVWQQIPKNLRNPPLNYSEIILRYGFLTAPGLKGLVKAWRTLYQYIGADLIIADHAPTALLAANTLNLKRVTIGTGFCAPPHISPLPNMRPWIKVPAKRLQTADTIALNNANSVISDLGGAPLKILADLFQVDARFLCTFPELDHYANRQGGGYWGSQFNIDDGTDVHWPEGNQPAVFVYLKTDYANYEKVLATLQDKDIRVVAYVPGIADGLLEKYRTDRIMICRDPVKLRPLLKDCQLAVCHAGAGTVAAMLLHGIPMMLLPTQLEQLLVSQRVEAMGAGLLLDSDKKSEKPDYGKVLNRLLTETAFRKAAGTFATRYAHFRPQAQYQAMASVIEKLLVNIPYQGGVEANRIL